MRKISAAACCVVAACIAAAVLLTPKKSECKVLADEYVSDQNIAISETNFPDEGFRNAIRIYDTNGDGILTPSERKARNFSLSNASFSSTEGIHFFINIETITLSGCTAPNIDLTKVPGVTSLTILNGKNTTLNITGKTYLVNLKIEDTPITGTLNLTGMMSLHTLSLKRTQISKLDTTRAWGLTKLELRNNMITSLDLSSNIMLETLDCNEQRHDYNNYALLTSCYVGGAKQLKTIDVSYHDIGELAFTDNPNLTKINCEYNKNLTKLDLSGAPELVTLSAREHSLTSLDLTNNPKLVTANLSSSASKALSLGKLDLSKNTALQDMRCSYLGLTGITFPNTDSCALTTFYCANNKLTSLNLNNLINLEDFSCADNNISSLTLPKNMSKLEYFYGENNAIPSLNFSTATKLYRLNCSNNNNLSSLDVTACAALEKLYCSDTGISKLDLSKNTKLTILECDDTRLTTLDLSNNTLLESVRCAHSGSGDNDTSPKITTLKAKNLPNLQYVNCEGNDIATLDLSGCTALTKIFCIHCGIEKLLLANDTSLKSLDCYDNKISVLDLTNLTNIEGLSCSNNNITKLDLTGCSKLGGLYCANNNMKTLIVKGCVSLGEINCTNNAITSLDVSDCAPLQNLEASKNSLTSLTLTGAVSLKTVNVENNQLTSLVLKDHTALKKVRCENNKLTRMTISNLPSLEKLYCPYNNIRSLDVTGAANLTDLDCAFNEEMTSLTIYKNSTLRYLKCYGNDISYLKIGENPYLNACINGTRKEYYYSGRIHGALGYGYEPYESSEYHGITRIDCGREVQFFTTENTPTPTKKPATPTPTKKPSTPTPTKKASTPTPSKKAGTPTPTPTPKGGKTTVTPKPTGKAATPTPSKKTTVTPKPSKAPTKVPTKVPSKSPTKAPTTAPTGAPTGVPGKPTPTTKPGKPTATPKPGQPTATPKPGKPTTKPGKPTPTPAVPVKDPTFEDFVERLYVVALGRASEKAGKEFWVSKVENGEYNGADCARFFLLDAPEFLNRGLGDSDFLEILYKTFYDRESDEDGKAYWMDRLENGTSRRDVVNDFIESTEWCNICATYGVRSGAQWHKAEFASKNAINFATRLYTCCLGRDPEEKGLEYWSLALTNLEQTGCSAAREFFTSAEFKGLKTSDEEYLKRLYTTFMDREPEASEVAYWAGEIAGGRQTRDSVLAFFGQSEEFTKICKKYGIERGSI